MTGYPTQADRDLWEASGHGWTMHGHTRCDDGPMDDEDGPALCGGPALVRRLSQRGKRAARHGGRRPVKILYEPRAAARDVHSCRDGLLGLGPRRPGTLVACICGRRWEACAYTFWNWVRFRLRVTLPMRASVLHRQQLVWRLHSFAVADWDDVPGEEAKGGGRR